ncbi:MAG: FHA domain-containing protein [Bacteroides sp.]|nr:FHA domain-containing protein [Bacteroides sp.]MCM1413712.1 FHA domain-containing protein [Bacteroides sp.]MCM1471891.1 FHA domain-containing protein [Bacteroides sp.]
MNSSKSINQCPNCGKEIMFDRSRNGRVKCAACGFIGPMQVFKRIMFCPDCNKKVLVAKDGVSSLQCPHCLKFNPLAAFNDRPVQTQPKLGSAAAQPPVPPQSGAHYGFNPMQSSRGAFGESSSPHTQILENTSDYRPGSLVLDSDDGSWIGPHQPIPLRLGRNVIGRAAQTSMADIKLQTLDMTISKQHINIEMSVKPDGKIKHVLKDLGSTNGTYLNDVRLDVDDESVLEPGNKIRLGHTVLRFELI